jgi:hypothetical protein
VNAGIDNKPGTPNNEIDTPLPFEVAAISRINEHVARSRTSLRKLERERLLRDLARRRRETGWVR